MYVSNLCLLCIYFGHLSEQTSHVAENLLPFPKIYSTVQLHWSHTDMWSNWCVYQVKIIWNKFFSYCQTLKVSLLSLLSPPQKHILTVKCLTKHRFGNYRITIFFLLCCLSWILHLLYTICFIHDCIKHEY